MKLTTIIVFMAIAATALSGCAGTIDVLISPIERANLDITRPAPLKLRVTKWDVLVDKEGKAFFALDTRNFENLTKNAEDIQNRLFLQNEIIDKQKEFYETELDKLD